MLEPVYVETHPGRRVRRVVLRSTLRLVEVRVQRTARARFNNELLVENLGMDRGSRVYIH